MQHLSRGRIRGRPAAAGGLAGLLALTLVVSCSDRPGPLGPAAPTERESPGPSAALTLRIVSGSEQRAGEGMPLSDPLVVEVADASGAPVPGVPVRWSVVSGEGSLRESGGETDEAGRHANHLTVGEADEVAQEVRVEVDGVEAVTFTAAVAPLEVVAKSARTWTGASSRAWEDPANWAPRGVPTAADVVFIAGHSDRSPVLSANASIRNIELRDNARLDIGSFELSVAVDVMVKPKSAITGTTGRVVITGGDCKLMGTVPGLTITGVVKLLDATTVRGPLTVAGQMSLGGHTLQVIGKSAAP
jgi:hypothetical protein